MDPTGGLAGWTFLILLVAFVVSFFLFPWKWVLGVGAGILIVFFVLLFIILSNARYT